MASLGLDIVDFVTVGIECTLRQLLEAGFFHAGAPPTLREVEGVGSPGTAAGMQAVLDLPLALQPCPPQPCSPASVFLLA